MTGSSASESSTSGGESSSTNEPGEGGGSYCTNAALLSPAIKVLVGRMASPTATSAAAQTFRMGGVAITRVLPDELRSAYGTAVRVIDGYIVALAAVGYDPSKVRPADAAPLSARDTLAALATIRTYDAQTCNIG